MKNKVYYLLACLMVLVLALSACGGDETTPTPSPTDGQQTTTSPTDGQQTITSPTTEPQPTASPTDKSPTTTTASPSPSPTTALSETPEPTETLEPEPTHEPTEDIEMIITSAAFADGEPIPQLFAYYGQDISPELNWSGVPAGTQSFALICDDLDAPGGTFTHWVIYNILAESPGLEEGVPKTGNLASGALQGRNSFGETGYSGPCPPPGSAHRYFFTLYALDAQLDLAPGAGKSQVLDAMQGHILAEAEIMGTYQS